MTPSAAELALMRAVRSNGGSLNLSAKRDRSAREIAYGLLKSGHLSGVIKRLQLTAAGFAALSSNDGGT